MLWSDGKTKLSGRLLLLFENKVDAAFQPHQAGRYHKEGAFRITKGDDLQHLAILFASLEYLSASAEQAEFDLVLPYEAIVEHFKERLEDPSPGAELRSRLQFKLRFLLR